MIRAEFLAIGDELLLGDTVNTNGAVVGRALARIGVACVAHSIVGDEQRAIVRALEIACARADAVIVSGGLGPTQDDLTRDALAAFVGQPLIRDERISAWLRDRFAALGRTMPEINLVQADVPRGARTIDPTFGTAPGLILEHHGCVLYVLPGVPSELEEMLERGVLPDLRARGGDPIETVQVAIGGVPESEIAERLTSLYEQVPGGIKMAYLPGRGIVRVRFTGRDRGLLEPLAERVREMFPDHVLGSASLEAEVARLLTLRGETLAAAESLTGGGFGEHCTRIPGASGWFRGSLVAYATETKSSVLGIAPDLLQREGPVSVPVVIEMATAARRLLASTYGVAMTGVAGPAEQGRAVGGVVVAVVGDGVSESRDLTLPGDRGQVRAITISVALNLVLRVLRR